MEQAFFKTAKEVAESGKQSIPSEYRSGEHLIYSSPATLAFNSPGAQGFGVKRAGLAIPGSVMLLVAPGCCGRNTSLSSVPGEYRDRFFFLLQDDTDIVTGRHLNHISDAVIEVVESLETKPSVVMICITCVDALLGTDMERVCRRASRAAGVPVLPCYMYALTREGRTPPMVHVRKTIYSLLEKRRRKADVVNLLGEFASLAPDTELYELLKSIGIKQIHEIGNCKDYGEYQSMSEANFNLVLNSECRLAADDFKKRLGIPSVEMTRLYQIDKIKKQYELVASALGVTWDVDQYYQDTLEVLRMFQRKYPRLTFTVGEWLNADPFELSLGLLRMGYWVKEIYGTITDANFIYIKKIAQISPDTRIYTNLSPTMLNYSIGEAKADLTLGKDAAYYLPECPNVAWNDEHKPFGFAGLKNLLFEMDRALEKEGRNV